MTNSTLQEHTPPSIGQILKDARLMRGLTLEQIAQTLCINKRQLSHLEEGEELLVCDVYKLGFVRLYAKYLGLDTEDIIKSFKEQAVHQTKSPHLIFPAPVPGRGMPNFRVLGLSFLALVAILIGWKWMADYRAATSPHSEIVMNKDTGAEAIKETTTEIINSEEVVSLLIEQPILLSPSLKEEIALDADNAIDQEFVSEPVKLQVTEKAWIEVKDKGGNIVINKNFYPGDSYEFQNSTNLFLTTGNLKGVQLLSADKTFPVAGKSGEVRRDIPLDPEKWVEPQPETH